MNIYSDYKKITLTGTETEIKFPRNYPVFGVKGENITVALTAGAVSNTRSTADTDGVVMWAHKENIDTMYLTGTGDVIVWAGDRPEECPFKLGAKGGGGGSGGGCTYRGTTTTAISNGSTTNPITIDGESYTAVFGDVVVYNYTEFVFDGTAWSEFGRPFDTVPTSGSTNAVTSDGVYRVTPLNRGIGENSVVGGNGCSANGNNSFAIGVSTSASGSRASAFGFRTQATQPSMTAIGVYNSPRTDDLFNIGNGVLSARSNIVEVNSTELNVNGDIKKNGVGIDDYTTTERKIGKWIDGSELYQRTFEVTGLVNRQWNNNVLGTSGINIVDTPSGTIHWLYNDVPNIVSSISYYRSTTEYSTVYINATADDMNVLPSIGESGYTVDKAVITIKYTKPSVQANALNTNIQQTEEPIDEMR